MTITKPADISSGAEIEEASKDARAEEPPGNG
jgi:hypothetical protein